MFNAELVLGDGHFGGINLEHVEIHFMVRIFVRVTVVVNGLIAPHEERASGDENHVCG